MKTSLLLLLVMSFSLCAGCVVRPARPAAMAEWRGHAPYHDAIWVPGAWMWRHNHWIWVRGYWC